MAQSLHNKEGKARPPFSPTKNSSSSIPSLLQDSNASKLEAFKEWPGEHVIQGLEDFHQHSGKGLGPWSLSHQEGAQQEKTLWFYWADVISARVNPEVNVYLLDIFVVVSWCNISIPRLSCSVDFGMDLAAFSLKCSANQCTQKSSEVFL